MSDEMIILVDEKDNEIGTGEKIKTHQEGKLHRAFSIFIFNSRNELLLQKRASSKYHSGGLWANTCCSHPNPGETTLDAAHRRLKEEMGFDTPLKEIFTFTYKIKFDDDMTEYEYDHVFIGEFNGKPDPDKNEVEEWKLISLEDLKKDVDNNAGNYAYWLKEFLDKLIAYVEAA